MIGVYASRDRDLQVCTPTNPLNFLREHVEKFHGNIDSKY